MHIPPDFFFESLKIIPSPPQSVVDLGAGDLTEALLLAHSGYTVTAIDVAPPPSNVDTLITYKQEDFHTTTFTTSSVDIFLALHSLSFVPQEEFRTLTEKIYKATKNSGFLVANVWGMNDSWKNNARRPMSFFTPHMLKLLLIGVGYTVVMLHEREWDGHEYNGTPKHWHTLEFVAKKTPDVT